MRSRIVVLALAGTLLVGACSNGGDGGATLSVSPKSSPAQSSSALLNLLEGATRKTTESSARIALDVTVSSEQSPNPIHITGSGEFDYVAKRGVIKEQIPDVTGSGAGTQEVEIRQIGETVYIRAPGAGTPAKPWVSTDASSFGAQGGSFGSGDPSQFLDYLQGASGGIRDEGEDSVRGTHTRKLSVNLDLRKAASKLDPHHRQAVEQAIEQLGTSTLPADVWIDDEGRLSRMQFSFHVDRNGQSADFTLTLELFDFGVKVDVEAPPPSQVSEGGPGSS